MADLRETAGKLIEHIRAHPEGIAATIRDNNPDITEDAAQRLALLFIGQFEPGLSAAERDQRGRAYRKALKASGSASGHISKSKHTAPAHDQREGRA